MLNQFLKYTAIGCMMLGYASTAQALIPQQDRHQLKLLETKTEQRQLEFSEDFPDIIIESGIKMTNQESKNWLKKPRK